MRGIGGAALVALAGLHALAGFGQAQAVAPAEMALARYLALGYDVGDGFVPDGPDAHVSDRVTLEDRRALAAVRKALEGWGRHVITARPEQADLLVAVRAARLLSVEPRVGGHGPVPGGPGGPGSVVSGHGIRVEASTPVDVLEVYESVSGRPGRLMWRGRHASGFDGSPPPLFEELRRQIERNARNASDAP